MAEDTATLADTVVADSPKADTAADTTATTADTKATTTAVDSEAAELGSILLQSGITKDKVNELLEAPGALSALRYAVENDPAEFLKMIEKASPAVAQNFHQKLADLYVERYDRPETKKTDKTDASSELMQEIKALREETNSLKTEQARRDQAAALASTQERYRSRVDDIFGQIPKEVVLTKSEQKAMRAQLDSELSKDPNIVARCSKGNFVDVAPTFKRIIDEWANDRKEAAAADKTAREKQQRGAFAEFTSGPNPFAVDVPSATFDSWDATEAGFAKALEGFRQ